MVLTQKERLTILVGAGVLIVLAVFQFGARPALRRIVALEKTVPQKRAMLDKILQDAAGYVALQSQLSNIRERLAVQDREFGLLAFLERIERQTGLAEKTSQMSPNRIEMDEGYVKTRVGVKIQEVSWSELDSFLRHLESADALVGVSSLHIVKNRQNPSTLDIVLVVVSLSYKRER